MNKRQKIIVSITGIFIVLLALVGLTYAYFLTQIRGNEETKSISVTTANLILEYTDGYGIITMSNVMPGEFTMRTKTFAVTNRGNETVENYNVYLENVINQLELKEDFRYSLTCQQYKTEDYNKVLSNETIVELLTEYGTCTGAIGTTFPSVMSAIATNTIEPGYTQYYKLNIQYLYRDYDQSIDMNKTVSAKVNIYDGKTKFLSTEIMNNTLANKENNSTTGTIYTLPNALPTKIAEEPSGSEEKILSYTLDDLGTSYYYRGNVNDNYVNFAGMCWRIVRIEGDGSIKLILEDRYTTCDDKTDSDGEGTDDYAYTGNWSVGAGNYGYMIDSEDYNIYKTNYLHPVDNADKSMVKAFYDFQNTFTTSELRKLKSGNWCLGDKIYTRTGSNPYTYSLSNNLDYSKSMYYDSYVRLNGDNVDRYLPTYKCNGRIMNSFESVIYNEEEIVKEAPMYVSGLTADEIVYAGGRMGPINDYYLLNDYQKGKYHSWSISYSNITGGSAEHAFFMHVAGLLKNVAVDSDTVNFRPTVSVLSTATITTKVDATAEPGTQNNPYVIN